MKHDRHANDSEPRLWLGHVQSLPGSLLSLSLTGYVRVLRGQFIHEFQRLVKRAGQAFGQGRDLAIRPGRRRRLPWSCGFFDPSPSAVAEPAEGVGH